MILLIAVAPMGCQRSRPLQSQVTINGRSWQVALAMTPQQRRDGLAGRTQIAPHEGMLFVFPSPGLVSFWMEGCLVDIDVAFIGPDMRVTAVHTMRAEPGGIGQAIYSSGLPAQYALEVRAGGLAAAGVKEGHSVLLSADIPSAVKAVPDP